MLVSRTSGKPFVQTLESRDKKVAPTRVKATFIVDDKMSTVWYTSVAHTRGQCAHTDNDYSAVTRYARLNELYHTQRAIP